MTISPRIRHFLVCQQADFPDPDRVASSLRVAGYYAEVSQDVPQSNFELEVAPNRSLILVRFSGDLHDDWDVVTSDLELLDDLVTEGIIPEADRSQARRFVDIGHWDHADRETVEALVTLLCDELAARVVALPWQTNSEGGSTEA